MKTLTFAVPCYNSAAYMDRCIESLLTCGDDVEILIIDDGSTKDDTAEIADRWQERHPEVIRAIHQPNGGHGAAVNTGLAEASGRFFKVVDSDDWLDADAMEPIMAYLRQQKELTNPTDMIIGNYVYEKLDENISQVMGYKNVFPEGREFGWDDVKRFNTGQYLLMHSVIYRTQPLWDMHLELPRHTFYVDNIFVYAPLPSVNTMRYFNVDMYRYYIGRADQSVNEAVMVSRVDQQLKITRIMIDSVQLSELENKKLRSYMVRYLGMMMTICSVFLRLHNEPGDEERRQEIWEYLKEADPAIYRRIRNNLLNLGTNLPTKLGRRAGLTGYHIAQKLFNFN